MELNTKSFATALVTITICALLAMALLVPIADSASKGKADYYDNPETTWNTMDKVRDVEHYSKTYTLDPVTKTLSDGVTTITYSATTPIFSMDSALVRMTGNTISLIYSGSATTHTIVTQSTLEIDDGTCTLTAGANTYTWEVTGWMFLPNLSNSGKYSAYAAPQTQTFYINSIEDIYFSTSLGSGLISGQGDEFTVWGDGTSPASYAMELSSEEVSEVYDVEKFNGAQYTYDASANLAVAYATYIVLPSEIIGHEEDSYSVIFSVIPIIVLVGLVIAAVRYFISARE